MVQTLSAAYLSFFAAAKGRKEYGNIIALRLFRSLHSINLKRYHYQNLEPLAKSTDSIS